MPRRSVQPPTTDRAPALDLNLLVVFEALWAARSVTGAGKRLGLSQPATSGALARLREMLGDRLFVRGRTGLEPTPRCAELAGPLSRTLVELRNVVTRSTFDPATSTKVLRVGAVDAAMAVALPRVLERTMREAPGVQVQVLAIDPTRATEALEQGHLDVALSPVPSPSASVRSRALYPVELSVVTRRGHPLKLARRVPSRAQLERFPRVQVVFQGGGPSKAAVVLSSFLAVPPLLAHSDAWALVPEPYARLLSASGAVEHAAPPEALAMPALRMQLLWPDAQHDAPISRWFRELVIEVAVAHLDRR